MLNICIFACFTDVNEHLDPLCKFFICRAVEKSGRGSASPNPHLTEELKQNFLKALDYFKIVSSSNQFCPVIGCRMKKS